MANKQLVMPEPPTVPSKTQAGTCYDKAHTEAEWDATHLQPWEETASRESSQGGYACSRLTRLVIGHTDWLGSNEV